MAAGVKFFSSMLLFAGVLSILTGSPWGEDVEVLFVVSQHLEKGGVLKIMGNTSVLSYTAVMTPIGDDFCVLDVTLSAGETYELNVLVLPQDGFFNCYCLPKKPCVLRLPSGTKYYVQVLGGYDCNDVACRKMSNPIRRVV